MCAGGVGEESGRSNIRVDDGGEGSGGTAEVAGVKGAALQLNREPHQYNKVPGRGRNQQHRDKVPTGAQPLKDEAVPGVGELLQQL